MSAFAAAVAVVLVSVCTASAQPAGGMLISDADLAARLDDPKTVVLHVELRDGEYAAGHVPGARMIEYTAFAIDGPDGLGAELPPTGELERVLESAGVGDDVRVVVYSNSLLGAARLFYTLDVLGHRDVALLDGGFRTWRDAGRDVATGPGSPVAPGTFTPRLDEARMATAGWIESRLGSDKMSLVDVRPDAEFTGDDGGIEGGQAAGHLQGARQLTWNSLVNRDGRFLPEAELAAKLDAAGVRPGRPVVAYCMVGMRASVVYFVARNLGYDTRLYDGSIVDWGRRGLPVVRGAGPGSL